ncbi:MAG: tyrosine--tRNA ligase [Holosporales bacterium]|nr:tyrosine--tRNA ligase [Holosporales bacterium]
MNFSSPVLTNLNNRGFLYQITDYKALDDLFCGNNKIVCYVGVDPTAKSLHVGHLLWIKLINILQQAGVYPIIIIGGATGRIGDPTWKDKERVMLDSAIIASNTKSITDKLQKFIKFDSVKNPAILLNNDEWISKINYIDFLKDFGPLFSVNKMLAMDSVSSRLARQQHLSFLEFNYAILQAYDFLYLFENYGCRLQIGGADQWSNMISGVDLIRKKTGKTAIGASMPLLTTAGGKKMGKTENGAIWLDENLTSPFDFWQFWRNVDDRDATKLMKLFTNIDIEEINAYDSFVGKPEINAAKIILANAITIFVHPNADLDAINANAKNLANDRFDVENVETFEVENGTKVDKILVLANLAPSLTFAKRLIDGNGVKINGKLVDSYHVEITNECLLSVGKKKIVNIKIRDR